MRKTSEESCSLWLLHHFWPLPGSLNTSPGDFDLALLHNFASVDPAFCSPPQSQTQGNAGEGFSAKGQLVLSLFPSLEVPGHFLPVLPSSLQAVSHQDPGALFSIPASIIAQSNTEQIFVQ